MNKLLQTPNDDQLRLLRIIAGVFSKYGEWPVWQHVVEELDRYSLDAEQVLRSLPEVGDGQPMGLRYGLAWFDHLMLRDDQRVGLTVAGMVHVPEFLKNVPDLFCLILRTFLHRRRSTQFDPLRVTHVQITRAELQALLPQLTPQLLDALPEILEREPPTMSGSGGSSNGGWSRTLRRELRHYEDVGSVGAYVERVAELLTPSETPTRRAVIDSPFSLPAALDYFNTVWQLHFGHGKPVVRLFSAERTARLIAPVNDGYEFDGQLNAVAELLKNLQVPGDSTKYKTPLDRLEARLVAELPAESHSAVAAATQTLRRIGQVRHSTIHDGSEHRGAEALTALGIDFPVVDWVNAWLLVQNEMIRALDALRREVQQFYEM